MIIPDIRTMIDTITPNLPTNIMDFRGFDSSVILILRGGIPRPIGDVPESLSQAILVGIMLVGRLGVLLSSFPPVRSKICSLTPVQQMNVKATVYANP